MTKDGYLRFLRQMEKHLPHQTKRERAYRKGDELFCKRKSFGSSVWKKTTHLWWGEKPRLWHRTHPSHFGTVDRRKGMEALIGFQAASDIQINQTLSDL